ncbi:MAG: FAD-binding protein, partial [Clostridia bacterium]|nr:FAD-binding protein [Clostridia bacterium]
VLKNRKVYLDFTKNPFGMTDIEYNKLSNEALEYLSKAEALFGTPIDRLKKMNTPAIELYKGKGLDITKEYLEIALCAQHNNGGIAVDMWWQTSVKGLFAAGECAGTHGITRPGGSALNAGQVGSLRAAQYISANGNKLISGTEFEEIAEKAAACHRETAKKVIGKVDNIKAMIMGAQRRMSDCAAAIRRPDEMKKALAEIQTEYNTLCQNVGVKNEKCLYLYYKLKDILVTQQAVLAAMIDYSNAVGDTRGSSLYFDKKGELRDGLDEIFRFTEEKGDTRTKIQETVLTENGFESFWRDVRPIPQNDDFFENIWRQYRENKNIY